MIHFTSPVELSPDRYLYEVRGEVKRRRARRVVVDSLSAMETGVNSARRFKELIYSLSKHMRASGATLLMLMEVPEMLGTVQLTGHAVSSIADNVVLLPDAMWHTLFANAAPGTTATRASSRSSAA